MNFYPLFSPLMISFTYLVLLMFELKNMVQLFSQFLDFIISLNNKSIKAKVPPEHSFAGDHRIRVPSVIF